MEVVTFHARMKKIIYKKINSTNALARQRIETGINDEVVLVAEEQSAGTGQYKRVFSSPRGGLYFSLLQQPSLAPHLLPLMTLATGVACADYLENVCHLSPKLKWPNDIMVANRKLGGILCESLHSAENEVFVILGIGINVNSKLADFPLELHGTVTTVFEQNKQQYCLQSMLEGLIAQIKSSCLLLAENQQSFLDKWQNRDYLYNRQVRYTNEQKQLTGYGAGICEDGSYLVRDYQGISHRIIAGQLRLL